MKRINVSYWIITGILAFMMAFASYAYIFDPKAAQGFQHLGFPGYFRIELAIAKFAGAILLLAPVSARIKEWVYASFGIVFISAFIAHINSGDPAMAAIMPLFMLVLLIISYRIYFIRQRQLQQQNNKELIYA